MFESSGVLQGTGLGEGPLRLLPNKAGAQLDVASPLVPSQNQCIFTGASTLTMRGGWILSLYAVHKDKPELTTFSLWDHLSLSHGTSMGDILPTARPKPLASGSPGAP